MKQDIVCQFGDKNEIPSWKLNWRTVELFPVNMLLHNLTVIVATSLSFLIKLSKKVRMFFAIIYFSQFSWVKNWCKKKLFVNLAIKKKIINLTGEQQNSLLFQARKWENLIN